MHNASFRFEVNVDTSVFVSLLKLLIGRPILMAASTDGHDGNNLTVRVISTCTLVTEGFIRGNGSCNTTAFYSNRGCLSEYLLMILDSAGRE